MTWTIASILDWTTLYFQNHGIESPHLEAEMILSHSLGLKRIDLYVQHDRILKEEELACFKKQMLRRVKKEPTSYITGIKPFMSLDIIVSRDVLIPRPDTEKLVEMAVDLIKGAGRSMDVLDIGTGSGAIAVSIAKYATASSITAVDISPQALDIAKQNAVKHGVENRIRFIEGDLFSPIPGGKKFDIIVSNPPYIPTKEIETLQPEIKNFEPVKALDGGQDGLDFYRKIIPGSAGRLSVNGHLLLEVGMGQAAAVAKMIQDTGQFDLPSIEKDYSRIDRVVKATLKA